MKLLRGQISLQLFAVTALFGLGILFNLFRDHPQAKRSLATDMVPTIAGEEWGPKNEDQIKEIVAASEQILNSHTGNASVMKRDAHPKQHGCSRAYVDIDSHALPEQYRVGIFAKSSHYEAWSRFSNGSPSGASGNDLDKDVRGFALKLMNVEGSDSGSQDLLLTTSEEFFSRNGREYASFHRALARGNWFLLPWMALHPRFAARILTSQVAISNVLHTDYFSTVPYRLGGDHTMRFSTQACTPKDKRDALPEAKDNVPNYLHTRLVHALEGAESQCFNFFVQPNENPGEQPIEDPTVAWDEKTSPKYWVGKVTFPGKQNDLESDGVSALCENMTFSPWHSFPETRPVGQINRIRKVVYAKISQDRHMHNGVAQAEPHDFFPCADHNNPLCKVIR